MLDIGSGEGELTRHLPPGTWTGVDASRVMVAAGPATTIRGNAEHLPFADGSLGSAALLYVLYHLAEPRRALAEACRVLRPGGTIAVALPSRHDSPELVRWLPDVALTADAESAPELLSDLFTDVEVEPWDAPLLRLRTPDDLRDYLIGKLVAPDHAARAAAETGVPLTVTKRGALVFARKRR